MATSFESAEPGVKHSHAPWPARLGGQVFDLAGRYLGPLVDLGFRVIVFNVFFFSGLVKIRDWESTKFLFEYEYMVPMLSPAMAASLATVFELGLSVLVLIGLFSRYAAIPLLGMAMVIQFVLGAANPAYNSFSHFMWMAILLHIIVRGPGPISLDYWLAGRYGLR